MTPFEEVRAELLSPDELDTRVAESGIAYLPLGTLEFHGPHLPIGLDAFTGHGVCVTAAQRSGGIVLPSVYQGFGGGHGRYPWTIMMPGGEGIRTHLRATLIRLEEFGVRVAVIFSGHFAPEQLEMIDALAAEWNGEGAHELTVVATAINRCPSSPLPPDHAGRFETTMLAGIAPDLVHIDRLPALAQASAEDSAGDEYGDHRHDPGHPIWGVFGPDPRESVLSEGSDLLAHFGEWLAEIAAGGVQSLAR
ncbi:MAG: creatininase family protein [Gulosibacter sp.]|uniref:creatininase family protein n=1 Tax=Gulosibacter sp. TaxID=2817531 RepID=UPI003F929677